MSESLTRPGFLICWNGGTGVNCSAPFAQQASQRCPFPVVQLVLDTDPESGRRLAKLSDADTFVPLQLTARKINVVEANAGVFGPTVEAILANHRELLDPHNIHQGSRTVRLITEIAFRLHHGRIRPALRAAILRLLQKGEADHIVPILVGSTGGGCGSALIPLLARALGSRPTRQRLLRNLNVPVRKPIVFAVDPLAQAEQVRDAQGRLILANSFGFRDEVARYPEDYEYVFWTGFASGSGVVLDRLDTVARVVALGVHQLILHWSRLKAIFVNNVDSFVRNPYLGMDRPDGQLALRRGKPPDAHPTAEVSSPARQMEEKP
jgi:hypothetical protein